MFKPVLVILTLLVLVLTLQVRVDGRAEEPQVVNVTVRRFEFDPATITVAVGRPVRLMVHSEDGVHGMEIKKFKVNKDIPRGGDPVIINFTPTTAGEFPVMCSEYCGDGHDMMRGTLVVEARDTAPNP